MNPESFLDTACYLLELDEPNQSNTTLDFEPDHRSAASRAYYAVFLASRELLSSMGKTFNGTGADHGGVRLYLNNSGVNEARRLATYLKSLRKGRNNADYDLIDRFTYQKSHLLYKKSVKAIRIINQIKENENLFQNLKSNI